MLKSKQKSKKSHSKKQAKYVSRWVGDPETTEGIGIEKAKKKLGKYIIPGVVEWSPSFQHSDAFNNLAKAYLEVLELPEIAKSIKHEHIAKTPYRVAKALAELLSGYAQNPEAVLTTSFSSGKYNQMILVNRISFTSLCQHHILPFHGYAYFAYIPNGKIVGLSKIPRLVEVYSKRLQVQETLAEQIVDTFQKVVKPKGCAIVLEARHECMSIRGIKQQTGWMRTVALRGIFEKDPSAKEEFLLGIKNGTM